ncbi:MAG: DUF4382 domain-containing protein [bacterium]
MRNFTVFLILPLLLGIFLIGCGKSPTTPTDKGTLIVSLTDAPAEFQEVNITFSEISAHIDEQWITVRGEPITVNLLEWNNGQSIVIGTAEVPAGHYTQIRLKIDNAQVVVNGESQSVTVPSGAQTGLKLVSQFTIPAGSTFELIIDFDANSSIFITGPPNNSNGYILKPTIRVISKAITGSISGTVTNPDNPSIAYAIVEDDTVTSTPVDKNSGVFMLTFLPEGTYTVSIKDILNKSFVVNYLEVVVGSGHDLGMITLQQ